MPDADQPRGSAHVVQGAPVLVSPHAVWLRSWVRIAIRRRFVSDTIQALSWSTPMFAVLGVMLLWRGVALPLALTLPGVAAVVVAVAQSARRAAQVSIGTALEARIPHSRNLLHTALTLASDRSNQSTDDPGVRDLVLERAHALAHTLDVGAVFPLARTRLAMRVAASAGLLVLTTVLRTSAVERADVSPSPNPPDGTTAFDVDLDDVWMRVTPPAYLNRRDSSYRNPSRITVPATSRVQVTVSARDADSVILEWSESRQRLTAADGAFTGTWRATDDEVLAVQAYRDASVARAFVGVTVARDADPRVRIAAPGRDLVLPRGDTTLRLLVNADDDHALGSLTLRYTKVSGSGERYSFVEGTLPLTIRRLDAARWEASASWSLATLSLEPGDVVVYRAVATDRRPDAPEIESDAWIAEVMTGRGDGAAGFAVDVGELRYALSQQMIVMRIERLLAARDSLGPALRDEVFAERARNVAVEQRRVRAEFVFLLGGELSEEVAAEDNMGDLNEHQHAEVDADLSTGRVRNEGRQAVQAAIRAMSRAASALADTALSPALAQAREAITQLEIAFTRARFLMRPLAERERIDMTRRLTGVLAGVASSAQPRSLPFGDAARESLTAVLRELAMHARSAGRGDAAASRQSADAMQRLAGAVLRARATDPVTQEIALALNAAAAAERQGDGQRAATSRDQAALLLNTLLFENAPDAVRRPRSARAARLETAPQPVMQPPPT